VMSGPSNLMHEQSMSSVPSASFAPSMPSALTTLSTLSTISPATPGLVNVSGRPAFRGGMAGGRAKSGPGALVYAQEVEAARMFLSGGQGPWNNAVVRRVVHAALMEDRDAMEQRMGDDGVAQLLIDAKTNREYLGAEAVFILVAALKKHLGICYDPKIFKRSPEESDLLIPHPYYVREGDDNGEFRADYRPLHLLLENEGTSAAHISLLLSSDYKGDLSRYTPFMEACRYQLNGETRDGLLWPQRGSTIFLAMHNAVLIPRLLLISRLLLLLKKPNPLL
jgi:hypothetical protein